jgi:hypothetical protein
MLHEKYVIYSFQYYSRFQITAVYLGTHYPRIGGTTVLFVLYKYLPTYLQQLYGHPQATLIHLQLQLQMNFAILISFLLVLMA